MLQIRLFGKPQVICDGTDITPELGNKGCALLCILFLVLFRPLLLLCCLLLKL